MPSILKIRRDWSLFHFDIRRDRSPHKILKIQRDWSLPFGEIWVPPYVGYQSSVEVPESMSRVYRDPCLGCQSSVEVLELVILHKWECTEICFIISLRWRCRRTWVFTNKKEHFVVALIIGLILSWGSVLFFFTSFVLMFLKEIGLPEAVVSRRSSDYRVRYENYGILDVMSEVSSRWILACNWSIQLPTAQVEHARGCCAVLWGLEITEINVWSPGRSSPLLLYFYYSWISRRTFEWPKHYSVDIINALAAR